MALWLFSLLEALRACRDFFISIAEFLCPFLKADLLNGYQELFGYSPKRWIADEDARLEERYMDFNVSEFRLGVCELLDVPYVSIAKIRCEDYSKIYSLKTMKKKEVWATMPTAFSGPVHPLVVTQVATMEFVSALPSCHRSGGVAHPVRLANDHRRLAMS
jgi:hypothetical protein